MIIITATHSTVAGLTRRPCWRFADCRWKSNEPSKNPGTFTTKLASLSAQPPIADPARFTSRRLITPVNRNQLQNPHRPRLLNRPA